MDGVVMLGEERRPGLVLDDEELAQRASRIALVLTDCDGVLTDTGVYYSAEGEELKRFSIRDGMGVERLRHAGIGAAIVTGERSGCVARRADKLHIRAYLGVKDKRGLLEAILAEHDTPVARVAYIGDDVNDLAIMKAVAGGGGLCATPGDGVPMVAQAAHYVTRAPAGQGAFRDFAEWILRLRAGGENARQPRPRPSGAQRHHREVSMNRSAKVRIGDRMVGDGEPVFTIGEVGINHNGSVEIVKKLVDGAALSGCSAVKLQKRTPERCVPKEQWHVERDTPWGRMTYIDYRHRIELGADQYAEIDRYCRDKGVIWFASCWDEESVDFIEAFDPPCYKAASASLTDLALLQKMQSTGKPLILSTGMSTMEEIETAIDHLDHDRLLVAHSTSAYPCRVEELNLRMILTLKEKYPHLPIGYSGHETGLVPTFGAVALGATFVERHITVDRAMWGSDQAASVEIVGLMRLVSGVRDVEAALGDGVKRVYDSELGPRAKLRRVQSNGHHDGVAAAPASHAAV